MLATVVMSSFGTGAASASRAFNHPSSQVVLSLADQVHELLLVVAKAILHTARRRAAGVVGRSHVLRTFAPIRIFDLSLNEGW